MVSRTITTAIGLALALFATLSSAHSSPARETKAPGTNEPVALTQLPEGKAAKIRADLARRGINVPEPRHQSRNTVSDACGSSMLDARDSGPRELRFYLSARSFREPIAAVGWSVSIFDRRWIKTQTVYDTDSDPYWYTSREQRVPRPGYYTAATRRLVVVLASGRVCSALRPFDFTHVN